MLDTLLGTVKNQIGNEIMEKVGVDKSQLDDVMKVVGGSVTKEVAKEAMGGGVNTVMNLFSNTANTTHAGSLQERITKSVVTNLIEKLGFNEQMSAQITTIVMPVIIGVITKKNAETPDDDPSLLEGLFDMAMGGAKKQAGGILGNVLGKLGL